MNIEDMKCPKKYHPFDYQNNDCSLCRQGRYYQICQYCKKNFACAGWADDTKIYCCECYKVKYDCPT